MTKYFHCAIIVCKLVLVSGGDLYKDMIVFRLLYADFQRSCFELCPNFPGQSPVVPAHAVAPHGEYHTIV